MKFRINHVFLLTVFSALAVVDVNASAQQIYRCTSLNGGPTEYVNSVKDAQAKNCKPMTGGNVTVVQGMSKSSLSALSAKGAGAASAAGSRTDGSPEQHARDSDSRGILESELKKAEAVLADQEKEYNNGAPEKQGIEGRNYQRYLDRVAEMKNGIIRSQSDVAGLKREISRTSATN